MLAAQTHFTDIIHLFELGTLHKELLYLLEPLERFVQDVPPNLQNYYVESRSIFIEFCQLINNIWKPNEMQS